MKNNSSPGQQSEKSVPSAPKQLTRETKSGITYFEATPEQLNSPRVTQEIPAHTTLLSGPQVARRLGMEFDDLIEAYGNEEFPLLSGFPDPAELNPGLCRWLEYEVDGYINRRIYFRNPGFALKVTDWQKFVLAVS